MTYRTPKVDGDGAFKGDLSPLGVRIDASGGWWDAGDYLKFVQTTSYTDALLLVGVRDFPAQMGAGAARPIRRRGEVRRHWLLRMWDDGPARSTTRSASATGTRRSWATTTSGGCRRPTTRTAGNDPAYRYIRNRPVFRAGPPGSPISPNLAGRLAAAFALCYQVFGRPPRRRERACSPAEHIFDLANTTPTGQLPTASRSTSTPSPSGATTWSSARPSWTSRSGRRVPGGLPHTDPAYYLSGPRTGPTPTSTGPNDAADTLNLYDVSGLAHSELYRASRGRRPAGLAVTQAGLLADLQAATR